MKELIYYIKRINRFDDIFIPSGFSCIKDISLECYKLYLYRFDDDYSNYRNFEIKLHLLYLNCCTFVEYYKSFYNRFDDPTFYTNTYKPFYRLCSSIIKFYNIDRSL